MTTLKLLKKNKYSVKKKKEFLEVAVDSVSTFVELTMLLRAQSIDKQEFWSFRGQRNEKWPLGLKYKFKHRKEVDVDQTIDQFIKRCKEFPKPDYINENPNWNWLFFAQHNGLRTRLLDWTSNPLVALYFAVENINSTGKDQRGNKLGTVGAVWMLKVNNIHFLSANDLTDKGPDNLKQWKMIDPPPITHRISCQSGKFSFHPLSDSNNISKQKRRAREEELIKIVLLKKEKLKGNKIKTNPSRDIRAHLGIMNIHHGHLFPDHSGIAMFVNNEWPIISPKSSKQ